MEKSSKKQRNRWPKIDLRKIEEDAAEVGRQAALRHFTEELRKQTAAFSPYGGEAPSECPAPEAGGQDPIRRHRSAGRVRAGP